jgi:hypothetical protein
MAPPCSFRQSASAVPLRWAHCAGMFALAEGACIVSFAVVDAVPVVVAAPADMASASASAPAKVDAVNVVIDGSCLKLATREFGRTARLSQAIH